MGCDIHTHAPAQKKLCKLHTVPIRYLNMLYKLSLGMGMGMNGAAHMSIC